MTFSINRTTWALYNEIDDYAADWIENLIRLGVVAPGIVDRRSIEDLRPDDLRGFRQVHLFAGVAVWSYSLRRAGVSDDVALWTGSCPCQPFSAAGKGGGMDDERHLWPAFYHLIKECRPVRVLGEQVASSDGLNWLDLVFSDLEAAQYALGAVDTCSAGSGAPHIRQRLRFAAYDTRLAAGGLAGDESTSGWSGLCNTGSGKGRVTIPRDGYSTCRLDNDDDQGLEGQRHGHSASAGQREAALRPVATAGGIEWVADNDDDQQRQRGDAGSADGEGIRPEPCGRYNTGGLADNGCFGIRSGQSGNLAGKTQESPREVGQRKRLRADLKYGRSRSGNENGARPGPTNGLWRDADWLFCRDEKWRPVEPGTFPLVDGTTFHLGSGSAFEGKSRQGMLKGYGNAIDAEATADFIEAYFEWETGRAGADALVHDFSDVLG